MSPAWLSKQQYCVCQANIMGSVAGITYTYYKAILFFLEGGYIKLSRVLLSQFFFISIIIRVYTFVH